MLHNLFSTARLLALIALISTLIACGGSSENQAPLPQPAEQPPPVNQPSIATGPLSQAGGNDVERFIKNGIYALSIANNVTNADVPLAANESNDSAGFSITNTIEQGVDEADRIKYDGNFLYLAETEAYFSDENPSPRVKVLARNPDFSLSVLPYLEPSFNVSQIEGMYLHNDTLSVIGRDFDIFLSNSANDTSFFEPNNDISISIFDVSDPANAVEAASIQIEGAMSDSRRIDDNLYVVSNYTVNVDDIVMGASTDDQQISNYTKIYNTPINQIMPKIIVDGEERLLSDTENCYIPEQANEFDGNNQFVFVTKINLSDLNDIESLCVSAYSSLIYASVDNLYVVSSDYFQSTSFHKISLNDLNYQASGTIDGLLGWRSHPGFRMDEANEELRVISTDYSGDDPVHTLQVLKQNGTDLDVISTLPNEQNPETIGKPGEDVFAARFIDEKAYLVTFEQIDPLYVINLSDNSNPFIEGSLEIPGFSSYIHPLSNNYLLGIGQEVELRNVFPDNPDIQPQTVTTGLKISLFDVNDPSAPIELSTIVTPSAYTPVEFEYKALSVLTSDNNHQFALPFQQWVAIGENGEQSNYTDRIDGLMLLETNTGIPQPSLARIQTVKAQNTDDQYYYSPSDRSIIQGDKVYYIRGNHVYLSDWAEQSEVLGPY